jgi:hypothetical protein
MLPIVASISIDANTELTSVVNDSKNPNFVENPVFPWMSYGLPPYSVNYSMRIRTEIP